MSKMQVSVRLDKGCMNLVDHYCVDNNIFRSEAMEILIMIGLESIDYKVGRRIQR